MDEEYKQSDISKEVQRLMDEEGYEFGEAVKEAMAQGYKDGGLMIAIQKLAQGGMTYGDKTYHQYHDQFVPPDTENMMYANGGGIGSMMQPKINVPQLVTPSADGSRPGYRGPGGYQGGGGGSRGGSRGGGGPPGGGDRSMRSSPSSRPSARESYRSTQYSSPKSKTSKPTFRGPNIHGGGTGTSPVEYIGGKKYNVTPSTRGIRERARMKNLISNQTVLGGNKVDKFGNTKRASRFSGIMKNFNPLSLIAGLAFGPVAGLATRAITTPGIRTGITNALSGLNEKVRGINPVTGKVNTQAEYEAAMADRRTQKRIDRMTDRMLAGKNFSQKNLDTLLGQVDRFGNQFTTNLGNIDNVRGPNSTRAQLNAPVVESIINEVIKAPPAKPNVTRDITYGDFPNAFNYLDVEDVDLYGTPKSTMPNYDSPAIMNPAPIERADPFSIDLSNAMADASTNTNQQILDTILNESIMKNQVQPYIDKQQKNNEEIEKMRQELGLA